jgi:hypothetical protein
METNPWMYVVLLGLVLIVYAKLLPKSTTSVPKNNMVQEIEETIEHFAVEMDEQNRAILDVFTKTRQDYEVEMAKLSGRLEILEKQKNDLSVELSKIHLSSQIGFAPPQTIAQLTSATESVPAASPHNSLVIELESKPQQNDKDITLMPNIEKEEPVFAAKLSMKSRYPDLFSLYDQGKGVEMIAKKLGMNKGEVNLIIQLARREERSLV